MLFRDESLIIDTRHVDVRYRGCGRVKFKSNWERRGFPFPRNREELLERQIHTSRAYTTRWKSPVGSNDNRGHYSVVLGGRYKLAERGTRPARKPFPPYAEPRTSPYARLIGEDAAMTLARP